MEYIPGFIHERFQKEYYFEMTNELNISVCNENFRQNNISAFNDDNTYTYELTVGDVICVKYFRDSEYSVSSYAYLVSVNSDIINRETCISKELIDRNPFIFKDVTIIYERDEKINNILN